MVTASGRTQPRPFDLRLRVSCAGKESSRDRNTRGCSTNSVARGAALSRGPGKVVPTTTATPFGSPSSYADQPGLAIAMLNGNLVVPTGIPFGSATSMARGNMVAPATTTTPLSGGIRTRHGRTGGTSLFGASAGRFR
jgi:hypothetical protein